MRVRVYKVPPESLRTLVDWARTGINSVTGRAYCSPDDRVLIERISRNFMPWAIPPRARQTIRNESVKLSPQLDATAQLAAKRADRDDPNFYYRNRG